MKNYFTIAIVLLLPLVACTSSEDSSEMSEEEALTRCQEFCEEENEDFLQADECDDVCSVTCNLAANNLDFTCTLTPCDEELCMMKCAPTDFPLGFCNKVMPEGIYWGCNCFKEDEDTDS